MLFSSQGSISAPMQGRASTTLASIAAVLRRCFAHNPDAGRAILIEERRTSDGGIIGLRVDITEMKKREASFRLLFDSNPVPMFVYGLDDFRILSANDAAVKHYGYDRDQVLRMSLLDIHH